MKLFFSIILLLSFGMSNGLQAQAPNCGNAYLSPFCSGIAQYPANFDGTGAGSGPQAPAGPNYDCLGTQGNPSFFSLTIDQTGSIDFILDNTSNLDIDFILWGPYADITAAQLACDSMGQGGVWGDVTDCSYSISGQEPVSIASAVSGEVYILMVTNFTNTATNIFSTNNTGTGSVACPCEIPYTVDTLPAVAGNRGYLTDTVNGISQFVVCPNTTLGFQLSASGSLNDTISLYAPFTTINTVFSNNTILSNYPTAPRFDSLDIFALITPTINEIGVNDFTVGLRNDLFTNGFSDSTCFDFLDVQVIVPGVALTDRNVCPGEQFQIEVDSIPSTYLGSSAYSWRQLSGIPVTFSSTTAQNPTVTIPTASSSSSNDSIILVVDYTYGGLCPMTDTMVLRFSDLSLTATALPDSVCAGSASTLDAVFSSPLTTPICNDYEVTPIPFAPIAGTGTQVTNFTFSSDDGISTALPIGFSFEFFCNTYTQFILSTNGFLSFDLNSGNGCCSGGTLPDPFDENNLIALAWEDLNVTGSALEYFTVGTAPNRILVVNYNNINHFGGTNPVTVQALLYETTNVIEIHTTSQPDAFGIHTQGIENAGGTIGVAVPGRNAQSWTATNDAFRFSPRSNGPFFTWSPAGSLNDPSLQNPTATPSITTNYVVAATDNTCIYTDTVEVAVISNFPAPVVTCDSSSLTSISFSWSAIGLPIATGFYEYSLDGGATWTSVGSNLFATVTGLTSNTSYAVLVRGNSGAGGACPISSAGTNTCTTNNPSCTGSPAISITLNPTDPICNGDSTGCVSAVVTGGSGNNNFGFFWSTGQTDTTLICDLPAGTYSLTVTDTVNSVTPPTTTILYQEAFDGVHNWTLNVPTGTNGADNNFWTVSSDEAGQPVGACGASGGSNQSLHITSVAPFGTGAIYDAGGLCPLLFCPETNMRAESPAFSTIGFSTITFEFNYIANGDGLVDNAVVWYNDGSGWQVLNNSIKSPLCPGGQGQWARFSASLPASCDNQPAVQVGIEWTNNDDGAGTDPSVAIDSVVLSVLQGGVTSFVCVDSQTFNITEPTPVVLTIDSSGNPSCNGAADGYIAVSTTGGVPGYSYNWNNLATSDSLTGLNAGTFYVTASDVNGCSVIDSVTLSVPNPIVVTVDSSNNPSCNGSLDGSVYISVTGGTPTYTYLWNNGSTTDSLVNVGDSIYVVTVTDANGCSITNSTTLTAPAPLVITIDSSGNPTCSGATDGFIAISVVGGTQPYAYAWSNTATTDSLTGLGAGTYDVTVTDANGCVNTEQVILNAPTPLVFSIDSFANVSCNGGTDGFIATSTSGGTPIYNYIWSNTTTTDSLTGLGAGTYDVTITDANGCSITDQQIITEPTLLIVNIDSTLNPTCNGSADGYIAISATGGTAGYTYLWNTGDTTAVLVNLNDGTYSVTTTDANGCTATGQVILNVPNPIVVTSIVTNNSCSGQADGSIDLTAIGGFGNFSYLWSNTATTQDLIAVPDGIYSVTVTDANGCFVTLQDTIVPTVALTITDSVETGCAGDSIVVSVTVNGGSGLYNYDWGTASSSTTDTAQFNLASGTALTVVVTVTDGTNGCTILDTIDLVAVDPVVVTLDNIQDIPCGFTALGQIDITASGGAIPYNYLWSDNSTNASLTSATPGNFSVTVTDANGCTATAGPFTMNQALTADVSVDTINLITACDGQPTGALLARASDPATTFAWSNGTNDSLANNLAAGTYTVVATNPSGCVDSATVTIIAPTLPTLNAAVQTAGTSQVSVPLGTTVALLAGSTGFDYLWTSTADPVTGNANIANPALGSTTASPDPAGDYWYIVTASATTGDTVCAVMDTVMVTVEEPFNGIPNAFTPNGDGVNDLFRPTFLEDEEVTSFRVFNRWGQLIYNGDENHGEGWDGTYQGVPQPTEVYIYQITYKRASEPEEREVKGEFTLIR